MVFYSAFLSPVLNKTKGGLNEFLGKIRRFWAKRKNGAILGKAQSISVDFLLNPSKKSGFSSL